MKTIFTFTIILGLAFPIAAMNFSTIPRNFEVDLAVAKTEQACGVKFKDGVIGQTSMSANGISYNVFYKGQVVAKSSANNDSIFAKATCLFF